MSTINREDITVKALRQQIDLAADLRQKHDELKKKTGEVWAEYDALAKDIMETMIALDLKKMDGVNSGKVFYWSETSQVKVPKGTQEFQMLHERLQELGRDGYLTINYQTANSIAKELKEEDPDLDLESIGFEVKSYNKFGMRKG